jgi:hypothetical protein
MGPSSAARSWPAVRKTEPPSVSEDEVLLPLLPEGWQTSPPSLLKRQRVRMHPVGTRREREGVGRCAFVGGRVAGRGVLRSRGEGGCAGRGALPAASRLPQVSPFLRRRMGGWSKPRRRCFNLACRERARITGFFAPKEISFDPSSAP